MRHTLARAGRAVDRAAIREQFPALSGPTVFLENAGGSQVPAAVAEAIRTYMCTSYVQLGAGYGVADRCDEVVERGHGTVATLMNAAGAGQVILGSSSTQLITMLAGCYERSLGPGDEIVVTETGHEANIGPWAKLADRGVRIRTWRVDPETLTCPIDGLRDLLNERTRVVAVVHVSNLLGEIVDIPAVTNLVHEVGARIVVDGVAYAPHRAIDVKAWNVDWYVFSTYKVYGPHMAGLYGRDDALAELSGPNHFFVPREEIPYKFELGGVCHEGCAGLVALGGYLRLLAGMAGGGAGTEPRSPGSGSGTPSLMRGTVEDAFEVMRACEAPLQERLVTWLLDQPAVRVIGPAHGGDDRVGTVSFVHASRPSREIVAAAHAHEIGIRNGHMYAYRLCEALGIEPEDGVVRVSLVHYNTPEEIERLISVLEPALA